MNVLGIDPGTKRLGWALLDDRERWIESGVLVPPSGRNLGERLYWLWLKLCSLVHRVDGCPSITVALEAHYVGKFPRAALALGEIRGVVQALCFLREIPVFDYAPTEVKQAVWGGRAGKLDVASGVNAILQIPRRVEGDEADACAVALCHLRAMNLLQIKEAK